MPSANAQRIDDFYHEGDTSGAPMPSRPRFPNFYKAFDASPDRKWQVEVLGDLLRYVKMPAGWDSYDAPQIGWDTGMFALSILNDVMRSRTPIPQVVPSSAGGIQLEWHDKGVDLELHISAPYQCELWFQDHRQSVAIPISAELTDNFSALLKPIELLTTR